MRVAYMGVGMTLAGAILDSGGSRALVSVVAIGLISYGLYVDWRRRERIRGARGPSA